MLVEVVKPKHEAQRQQHRPGALAASVVLCGNCDGGLGPALFGDDRGQSLRLVAGW
jgi:hypothetical protein